MASLLEDQESLDISSLEMYGVTFRDSCFLSISSHAGRLVERAYQELLPLSRGVVVLSTCNRFEVYLDSPAHDRADSAISEMLGCHVHLTGVDAARHLLRVASGLESAILGEDEVLGQVRDAWVYSRRAGYSSELLDTVFHSAISAGARVRSSTNISRGVLGYPRAAVEVAAARLGGLDGRRVAVVGAGMAAGEMLQQVCSKWRPSSLVIADRSPEKARALGSLCQQAKVETATLQQLPSLAPFDVMLVAIKGGMRPELEVAARRSGLVVDISTPPASPLFHVGIDEIKEFVNANLSARLSEVSRAESIIEEELESLQQMILRKAVDRAISSIMRVISVIVDEEAKLTAKNIAGGQDPYQAVLTALNSTVKKTMFPIFSYLRESPESRAELAKELMNRYNSMIGLRGRRP
ncbi:Glutamyl-tRNA reductase [Acidilobus saccharovorans 345-15]|uniref:Glutamyl-tRNA reductase n=1 Tax=Acidilobus saccharovorans (strain DSM 16705 / JCM 18335 / VKM B-2471 / 345-15) TaxID=666510 RepID=D9PZM3_ACIS3|nr:Glutamyl-tRNA reductase [Acidilobus saccharovorans 345-15]